MKTRHNFASLLMLSVLFFSCTRAENDNTAGKGGNAVLRIVPKHHNDYKNIINATIYLKYNAQDAPASFDDSVLCVLSSGIPTGTFSNLKKGKYYITGLGYDTSIKQNVKGGIPYVISDEVSLDVSVPVTETHL